MPPPKLYLNEHLSPRLAEQLRRHGFDATSTLESKMGEADDDEQLAYAASEHRALVTFNHAEIQNLEHGGVGGGLTSGNPPGQGQEEQRPASRQVAQVSYFHGLCHAEAQLP